MPFFRDSTYKAPLLLRNGNISTIYCGAIKKTKSLDYRRERLQLPDGDFLLLDYHLSSPQKAVILCHGLEGNSRSHYNNTCAQYFLKNGYSVFAWNNRSCGGEMNLLPKLYHHGSIEDLEFVVGNVIGRGFQEIYLIGFSLGGAQILSYFGKSKIDTRVKAAVAVSTPIQLKSSGEKIEHGFNKLYQNQMVKGLKKKIIAKSIVFPDLISSSNAGSIKNFRDIVTCFLSPIHGFKNLEDYYYRASPEENLKNIQTPVLILNALDDPIIGKDAYPIKVAETSPYIFLETPRHGGHCAFAILNSQYAYPEIRAMNFFEKFI